MKERNTGRTKHFPPSSERGVALVVALLAMTVIAGLGFALLVSSSTESLVNASFRRASVAHYTAMAGVEELRGRMGPDVRPITADLTSTRIPCGTNFPLPPSTPCPPLFNSTDVTSGGIAARSADLRKGYYIRINSTIDPTSASCTYRRTGDCYDNDPNRPTAPVYFTTTQPGTAMPYVWTKVQVATQKRLKRRLTAPCDPTDPTSSNYCDPATLDNTLMVCWTGFEPRIAEDTNGNTDIVTVSDPSICGEPVNPLLIITSLSIQPNGTLRLIRELASLGRTPSLPGGLVLDGCQGTSLNPVFPPPTSNPWQVSGDDTGYQATDVHAVSTRCYQDMVNIQLAITDGNTGACSPPPGDLTYPGCQRGPNHNGDYPGVGNNNCQGATCNAANSADIFHDTSLSDPNTNPLLATCTGLRQLVAYIENVAYTSGYVYPAGTTNLVTGGTNTAGDGSNSNPALWQRVVNVIRGNAQLGQADFGNPGAGIILIEGNLDLTGYPTYNGLILIIGTGVVNISGGGNGTVNGGILVANTTSCDPSTDAPGPVVFNANGGGNFNLNYNSDAIEPLNGSLPVQKLAVNY